MYRHQIIARVAICHCWHVVECGGTNNVYRPSVFMVHLGSNEVIV